MISLHSTCSTVLGVVVRFIYSLGLFGSLAYSQIGLDFLQKSLVSSLSHPVQATSEGVLKLELLVDWPFGNWCYRGCYLACFWAWNPTSDFFYFSWDLKDGLENCLVYCYAFEKSLKNEELVAFSVGHETIDCCQQKKTVIFVWQCPKLWSSF